MNETDIPQLLEKAVDHYRAGRLAEAEAIYRQILSQDPNQADALHQLGAVAFRAGQPEAAVELIGRAIAARPGVPEYWSNLGSILNHQQRFDRGGSASAEAIRLNPEYADAYFHLGNALRGSNFNDKAIIAYQQAIVLKPLFPEALNALGGVLMVSNRIDEATATYRQAIAQRPTFAEAHTNLGAALQTTGQLEAAVASYQRAIQLQPDTYEASVNLGRILLLVGEIDQAIAACRKAIELQPSSIAAYNYLGSALSAKGLLDEASAAYVKAISLQRNSPRTLLNLGNIQFSQGKLDEAIASYDRAAQLSPQDPTHHSSKIYTLHFHPYYDADAILREQRLFNQRLAGPLLPKNRTFQSDRSLSRRLRIGYVSPHFCDHPIGRSLLPLLAQHDHQQFEIFCYANVALPDDVSKAFQSLADHWQVIAGLPDEAVAKQILDDKIDVLVDLALHMPGGRPLVFARKPAPLQVTLGGYPAGTGMPAIDFRLTDPHLDPPVVRESQYVERSIVLPDSFWCYAAPENWPAVNDLPARSNGHVTFGCLSEFSKINDEVIALWAKVLNAVPDSRLLLMSAAGSHRDHLLATMSGAGVAAARIEFSDPLPKREMLELYHRIDLGLDTFPFNGQTASLDSCWMGVPVVTLVGQTAVGRAGWSQLSNLGMTELAALDEKQFVKIASDFAGDLDRLAELRRSLRARMQDSPLMNAAGYARNVEATFRQIWRAWALV